MPLGTSSPNDLAKKGEKNNSPIVVDILTKTVVIIKKEEIKI